MQIKNKKKIIFVCLLSLFLFNLNLSAEEFNISAKEVTIDNKSQILIGKGSVLAIDSKGKHIYADKITYEKSKEFLLAEGKVKITDQDGNILKADKATYDKINEKIVTYNNTEVMLKEGYKLVSKNISYDIIKKILNSNEKSIFTDLDKNIIETTMFQYDIKNHLFSSIGKIKIIDTQNNKYLFKEIHIDTKKKEMIGSDVSIVLDQQNFGVSEKSDPRFVANDILIANNQAKLSKGVFTVCQKKEGKCPPWSIKAKKIVHDHVKKNIYYEHAVLKFYDVPIFYFPRFFHPDPTVKRQSGFLFPFFTNSTTAGVGSSLPYYWVINNNKDFTFSPKYYDDENILFLNEYRQAFSNGFLTLDTGFFEGYKNTSTTKTTGSQNHIFANLDLNLNRDESYESNLSIKVQRTNNETYFRKHDINTALVDSDNTNLVNEIKYSFAKDDEYLNIVGTVYEDIRKTSNEKYEYILPNIMFGKTFFTEKFGIIDFQSNALHNNYKVNRHRTSLTNDIIWTPPNLTTKKGFVNSIEVMLRNTNYEARKTDEYKDIGTVNEINGVLGYKSSFPMKKDGISHYNLFSPNLMVRYAPGHMRNISYKDTSLNYANLYSLNKTTEIEDGLSAILGFDFKTNEKESDKEKLSLSLGQVFNYEENKDMPTKSSLDQHRSDIVGEINYNFLEIGKIDYSFLMDKDFNALNYQEASTELNFGRVQFNLSFLEEQKHIGTERYATSGITLNYNDENKLSFSTKKNFKTESTEFYNFSYQYAIDCLTAGLVYRREFYQDNNLEPNDTLMFSITFIPFGTVNTPAKKLVTKIKKNIFIIIKTTFALVVFLTLVLFVYAAFFFDTYPIEKKTVKNEIVEEERLIGEKKLKEKEKQKLKGKNLTKQIKTTLKDGLYATVGNKAITRSDILNEIKSILILNNMTYSEDTREELQQMAVKSVIKKNIKEIEINKHDFLEFSQSDLSFHLNRIAKNANMDLVTLKDTCIANGLDFSVLEDKMKIELLWNSLVFHLYRTKIAVDPIEIEKKMKFSQNKKEFNEYLISEIMVKAVEKDKLESMINDIKKRIEAEGFQNVAKKLSLSESATSGGDLGWVNEQQVTKTFRSILLNTPVGGISQAILVKENILIFKVRDKRKIEKEINLEDLKNQLVESEKTKMLNMYSRQHYENLKRIVSIKFFNE